MRNGKTTDKTVFEHIRDHLLAQKGIHPPCNSYVESLFKSQWSDKFEELMRNRLVMGALRYGEISQNVGKKYARVPDAIRRLNLWQEDGNDEHLVDAANLLLLEFVCGSHPKKHFAADDDGEHCPQEN